MTSLARFHRELLTFLLLVSAVLLAAGTADAAILTLPDTSAAGIGPSSVPH